MKANGPTSRLTGECYACLNAAIKRPVFRDGLCSSHYKRRQRGQKIDTPIVAAPSVGPLPVGEVLDPAERVLKTGSDMVECSSENDDLWHYRRLVFLKSAAAWLESLGWRPPSDAARKLSRVAKELTRA